ncbi:MAG: hypothetical protein MI674_04685 [Cytophagales bacterium]|nr:hypothetical protein [Cytophagales bacterium]
MEIKSYNPSPIEVVFAKAISDLKDQLNDKLDIVKITYIKRLLHFDNPQLNIFLEDDEGKEYELVVRFIQRINKGG